VVVIGSPSVEITLYQTGKTAKTLTLGISSRKYEWQLSPLVQVCSPLFAFSLERGRTSH
jgi:hypothetical protein